jgi:alanine racemase
MNSQRWAWAQIDLGALRHNVATLAAHMAPQQLWAVIKADAYGHGAVECARVALQSGAHGLCVALAQEGIVLRQAGINAPILIMSEQPEEQFRDIISYGLIATLYNESTIVRFARTASELEIMASVHVKVDSGMHRVGVQPDNAVRVASLVAESQWLTLEGIFTHLATADVADTQFAQQQVSTFMRTVEQVRALEIEVRHVHISNSASAIRRLDTGVGCTMTRVGIAMYGIPGDAATNSFGAAHQLDLRPVMSVHARISHVQRVTAGQGVSYGLKRPLESDSTIATLPLGYADGIPRGIWESGSVLVNGTRRAFAGVVTMDQILVNCADAAVGIGDEVVLIGAQGSEIITANEWANKMGTIGYEIVCAISARMPRNYIN